LLGLDEQVAHTRRSDANDRLDELRCRHREEGHIRLAGDRAGEQGLAGTRGAGQQHPVGDAATKASVLLGVTQEVDHLAQLGLGLLDAGHIGEGDAVTARRVPPCTRSSEAAEGVLHAARAAQQEEQ
jgi:hypothetical protein